MPHRPATPGTKKLSRNMYRKPCGCTYAVVGFYTYAIGPDCAYHKAEKSTRDAIYNNSPKSLSDRLSKIGCTVVLVMLTAPTALLMIYMFIWLPLQMIFA